MIAGSVTGGSVAGTVTGGSVGVVVGSVTVGSVGGEVVTSDADTMCGVGSLTTAAAATANPPSDIAATMAPATLTRSNCDDQKLTMYPLRRRYRGIDR